MKDIAKWDKAAKQIFVEWYVYSDNTDIRHAYEDCDAAEVTLIRYKDEV